MRVRAAAQTVEVPQVAGGGPAEVGNSTSGSDSGYAGANEESGRAGNSAAEPPADFAGGSSTGGAASDAIEAPRSGEGGAGAPSVAGGAESESKAADSSGVAVAPLPAPTSASHNQPPAVVPPDVQLQPMQAGVVDDNADFQQYLQYRADFHSFLDLQVDDLDVSERYVIRVLGSTSRPVLGADVSIYDGQSLVTTLHTPATGLVYFFPNAYPSTQGASQFDVIVEKDQTSEEFTLQRGQNSQWDVTLGVGATQAPVQLDVLFLIDSTGSMGDEIDQLKNNILSISAQVAALPSRPDVRFGMVTYRDHGDQYVTRNYNFTRDVQSFQKVLMDLRAAGGGDTPEALNEGLSEAIYGMNWRGGETVNFVFLVADAPPQLYYPQDVSYANSLLDAAQVGIKIDPIASRLCRREDGCSGEDRAYQEQAEYIFRQMAQFTGGKFIFLAYEDTPTSSGTPGTDLHVTEDQYSVQDLDSLVVRLIQEELAALQGGQQ